MNDYPVNQRMIEDCRQLSSGTMATLTGITNYDRLDEIQADFVAHVTEFLPHVENWQKAWEYYENLKRWDFVCGICGQECNHLTHHLNAFHKVKVYG